MLPFVFTAPSQTELWLKDWKATLYIKFLF